MKKVLLVSVLAFLAFSACEKDKINVGVQINKVELKPEYDKTPTIVSVIYEIKVNGSGEYSFFHQGAHKSYSETDTTNSTHIYANGDFTRTDTLVLYYLNGGSYEIIIEGANGELFSETFTISPSNKEVIMDKKWKMTRFFTTWDDGSTTDIFALISDYKKDDYYIFKSDGSFIQDEGETKENPATPQLIKEGFWDFKASLRQDTLSMRYLDNGTNKEMIWQELVVTENKITCKRIDTDSQDIHVINAVNEIELVRIDK